ncbi:MAG: RNA 2'-phosphotransferase [Eubacteriaceae bacterium]|jgi:putative RNA 2'-phosphotransferase
MVNDIKLSKEISFALRHHPEKFDLELDPEGWTSVESLLQALHRQKVWTNLTISDIGDMNRTAEKQRFEIRNGKIRALYGHSLKQPIVHPASTPPAVLYHGTTHKAAVFIEHEGLKPMQRQNVHLSSDIETALAVGRRRDRTPVLFKIDTKAAQKNGVRFYHGNQTTWLSDPVPARFLEKIN